MIVNGSSDVLESLEPVLDAGKYDVVFVESGAHAYSHIKRERPNLVILCLRMDDAEGFQVLSMLKLDPDTSEIPVVTYASDGESNQPDEEETDEDETPMFQARPAQLMN
jgi:CheY-like chemotaxis protein